MNTTTQSVTPGTAGGGIPPVPINKYYITVRAKFIICHILAALWAGFSIYLSIPWLYDLSNISSMFAALVIIAGIAYIPGYLNVFLVSSLLLDKQPPFKNPQPDIPVTILIAARNEEHSIRDTLRYIKKQDYTGQMRVIVIDNGSTDHTYGAARQAGEELGLQLTVIKEARPGKFNALNTGLFMSDTEYVITLDADTLLHRSAVRHLFARLVSSPKDVCAVAGSVLVRNSRKNLKTRIQEWDYFLGISSIKRLQGLYQGTLVAQGAFSLYQKKSVLDAGSWPDAIGEDIVLTWSILKNGGKVYFEPLAVAFTDVPETWRAFSLQRSRWARGMIEALKEIKPWRQPQGYTRYLTGINLIMPYLDFSFALFWIPGLLLAMLGINWIVGFATILVLPLTFFSYGILYFYQRYVFRTLGLRVRKNLLGFLLFVVFYQMIMSPVSVWGYLQEFFKAKRTWK
jgi:biofilm PGA synthesis N-glycosyltransferase PgaC